MCGSAPEMLRPDSRLSDLGIDSLGRSVIAAFIAADVGIELLPEMLLSLYQGDTVGEMVDAIVRWM
jgi:acyl carrier protein